jgi:hypothetical protein
MRRLRLTDESGVATIIVVLLLPLFLLFGVFVVDVANWFVHKRHLQTQADAAALAGAGMFRFPGCVNADITGKATEYAGKTGQIYNSPSEVKTPQARLFAEVNQATYHGQSTPPDGDLPGDPCSKLFLDVKMTETDVPLFFNIGIPNVPNINAQARVKLFKTTADAGLRPIGVPDATPQQVRAFVVDEDTGTPVPNASVILTSHAAVAGIAQFRNDAPLTFSVPAGTSSNLGVRLALSGSTTTTACTTPATPLVNCYDSAVTNQGLSYIRTWADSPDPATNELPVARSVQAVPGSCTNASFTSSVASCTFSVRAVVKWNPAVAASDLGTKTQLTASYNGNTYPLSYNTAGPDTGTWTTAAITLPAGTTGPKNVSLAWEQQTGKITVGSKTDTCTPGQNKNTNCIGTFGNVQRTFWNDAGDQASRGGPVATLDVLDTGNKHLVTDLQRCSTCTASLEIDVGIKGSLGLGAANDPPVSLRVDGNQSQSLQCDPAEGGANGLQNMLANGCPAQYKQNTGEACPNKSALFGTPTPWPCVAIFTGQDSNSSPRGLNRRILCNTAIDGATASLNCNNGSATNCTHPNRWPNYAANDPRLVDVFLTPFGTFTGTGNDSTVPVIDFGQFYVTGYTAANGQGVKTPCANLGGADADAYSITPPPDGNISGHFVIGIKPNNSQPPDQPCDPARVGLCTPVLVK